MLLVSPVLMALFFPSMAQGGEKAGVREANVQPSTTFLCWPRCWSFYKAEFVWFFWAQEEATGRVDLCNLQLSVLEMHSLIIFPNKVGQ